MASFMNQLGKGFVRSAVNQVGREVGRQYYNAQKQPQQMYSADQLGISYEGASNNNGIPDNAEVRPVPFSASKIAILIIVSLFVAPLGSIGVLIYGICLFFSKQAELIWYEQIPQYVSDRRYSSGVRRVGTASTRRKKHFPATPELKAISKRNGKIAMIIGGVVLSFFIIIISLFDRHETQTPSVPTAIELPVDSLNQQ